MDEMNDELLNKFLDNELDKENTQIVERAIKNSEDLRKRFQALKSVHRSLMKMKVSETSPEFVNKVMSRLGRNTDFFKNQNYFLAVLYLIFLGGAVFLTGYVVYKMFGAGTETNTSFKIIDTTEMQFENISSLIKNFFKSTNVSLIGSILAFSVIISAYLFFELFKNNKTDLNKI